MAVWILPSLSWGSGLNRNGFGARSMGMTGADLASAKDALSALGMNPAQLAFLERPQVAFSVVGALADGTYRRPGLPEGTLSGNSGLFPEFALALPSRRGVVYGVSLIPDTTRRAEWNYRDAPGGIDGATTYGDFEHLSSNIAVRGAVGAAYRVNDRFALGLSGGLTFQENRLRTPYVFQSQPVLAGFKTQLDLQAEGFGPNAEIGFVWVPLKNLRIAASYRSPTRFQSQGTAQGNIGVQLANLGLGSVNPAFSYDAEVETEIPQQLNAGVSWKPFEKLTLNGQVEWIDWKNAFQELPVRLRSGNNPAINALVGSSQLTDVVPLDWESRFVYRAGAEYALDDQWKVRGGYSYSESPVPDDTLLPLTAAISEHTLGVGLGYRKGPLVVDVGYQYDLPASQNSGESRILNGEFDNGDTEIATHWLVLTVVWEF
ncbi:MAG: TonB-dependent receptor [Verrucomicrobiota bacterium]